MDWMNLGKEAIPGDKPTGIDMRYEAEFEALQAQIDKMSSPSASNESQVDWKYIVDTAGKILAEKSKDLTVASFLAVGLVHTQKIAGLDSGIQIIRDLIETYWDNLYPAKKRMRGRLGAITWWMEKTETEFKKIQPSPIKADSFQRMQENLKRIDEILVEKMPDPPLLRPVQRIVEALPVDKQPAKKAEAPPAEKKAPEASPVRASEAPKPAAAKPVKSTAPDTPDTIESDQDARKTVDAAFQKIRQASLFMLKNNLKDATAYRLRRLTSWAKVLVLPPNTDGKTQIPPPPPQTLDALIQLRDDANWPALIENAEQKLSQYVFWYDLNRLVAEALTDLGADYQDALKTVCYETSAFLQRMPGSENLTFSDGTPFADPDTRRWLQGMAQSDGSAKAPAMAANTGESGDNPVSGTLQKAKAMARKKQLAEAVGMLQQQMQQTTSRYRQMQWRLGIADVLLGVKKTQLALPHLEQILSDIDAFRLEQWDPQLALEGLVAALQAFSLQTTNDYKARSADLLARIAALDPVEALRLSK